MKLSHSCGHDRHLPGIPPCSDDIAAELARQKALDAPQPKRAALHPLLWVLVAVALLEALRALLG